MKKLTQWLALLLAAMLITSSMVACLTVELPEEETGGEQGESADSTTDPSGDPAASGDQTDDPVDATTTPAPTTTTAPITTTAPTTTTAPVTTEPPVDLPTPSSPYENLRPSELYTALTTAEDIGIAVAGDGATAVYKKDGDKLSLYFGFEDSDGITLYADLGKGTVYTQQEDGSWIETPMGENAYTWASLLLQMSLTADTYIFVDSNYEGGVSADGVRTIKESVLAGSDLVSAVLESVGATYILTETYADGSAIKSVISFEPMTVEFPAT